MIYKYLCPGTTATILRRHQRTPAGDEYSGALHADSYESRIERPESHFLSSFFTGHQFLSEIAETWHKTTTFHLTSVEDMHDFLNMNILGTQMLPANSLRHLKVTLDESQQQSPWMNRRSNRLPFRQEYYENKVAHLGILRTTSHWRTLELTIVFKT